MSDCKRELDIQLRELKNTAERIIKEARVKVEKALQVSAGKIAIKCGETFQNEVQTTIKKLKQEANKSLDLISKEVNVFAEDIKKIEK